MNMYVRYFFQGSKGIKIMYPWNYAELPEYARIIRIEP